MFRLLKIDLHKIWFNKPSRNLTIFSLLLPFGLILFASAEINLNEAFNLKSNKLGLFNFPIIWQVTTYLSALLKFLFAFVIVGVIGNEYQTNTLKQNLIDGFSKKEFIQSKFYTILLYSSISTIIVTIITLGIGLYSTTSQPNTISVFKETSYILAYFIKLIGFFSMCLFLALQIKRAVFAMVSIFIIYIVEWILYGFMSYNLEAHLATKIKNLFPLESMSNLIHQPFQRIAMSSFSNMKDLTYTKTPTLFELLVPLAWTFIFMYLSYKTLKKRDL